MSLQQAEEQYPTGKEVLRVEGVSPFSVFSLAVYFPICPPPSRPHGPTAMPPWRTSTWALLSESPLVEKFCPGHVGKLNQAC
jgi:hypothetical protein